MRMRFTPAILAPRVISWCSRCLVMEGKMRVSGFDGPRSLRYSASSSVRKFGIVTLR